MHGLTQRRAGVYVRHHGEVPDDAEPAYYAWLPGPWVIVKRSWQRRSTLRDLIIEAECEVCADRVVRDVEGGDEDARRRSVEQARLTGRDMSRVSSP